MSRPSGPRSPRPKAARDARPASPFAPSARPARAAHSDRSAHSDRPVQPARPAAKKSAAPAKPRAQRAEPVAPPAKVRENRPAAKTPPRKDSSRAPGPIGAVISRRASERLRSGHLWVYASDVESLELPAGAVPALLPVADNRGLLLGTALFSPDSQIPLRMIARETMDQEHWLHTLAARLHTAIDRRRPLLAVAEGLTTDSLRLCFSEADELPGLVIDKYAGLIVLQILVRGLDSPEVRRTVVRVLRDELAPDAILERPDPRMRELEGLSAPSPEPLWLREANQDASQDPAQAATQTEFQINGLRFHYDANSGQKTGAFLDQRANYAAARDWAARLHADGRALDVCTYQGGFALHLAQVCREVTGIDASRASLVVAEKNEELNRARLSATLDWTEADAFEILRDWSQAGERFDAIVLDPPAFAKSKRAVESALRGYKELNLRALRMLRPGGLLVTCSCSHQVGWADLEAVVADAAADAGRRVRLLERRGAALDHPVILNLPETEYLKCLILEAE